MDNWEKIQASLAKKGIYLASPSALLEWIEQVDPVCAPYQDIMADVVMQQQSIVSLLNLIIQDTDAAVQSIIAEITIVDSDVNQLAMHFNLVQEKINPLQHHYTDKQLDEMLDGLLVIISNDNYVWSFISTHISKLASNNKAIRNVVQRIITLLSFKSIMDVATADSKNRSFVQIAGELRTLARQGNDYSDDMLFVINDVQRTLEQKTADFSTSVSDDYQIKRNIINNEIKSILRTHSELLSFLAEVINLFNDAHRDVCNRVQMMYAQVQFQDIVRQKAERGINLIQNTINILQALNKTVDIDAAHLLLQSAITDYEQTDALHASFHHSGADSSHHGGSMMVDLF